MRKFRPEYISGRFKKTCNYNVLVWKVGEQNVEKRLEKILYKLYTRKKLKNCK